MLVEALKVALTLIMTKHVYVFNDELRLQMEGGAIGVDLTGVLADIFMSWWDREMVRRLQEIGIKTLIYERYVDDITLGVDAVDPGTKYNGERLIQDAQKLLTDSEQPADKVTFEVVKLIGDSIHSSVILETDFPSNHIDQKVPILDLKVWIDEVETSEGCRKVILHEHYIKEVSTKFVIHREAALTLSTKRTILTQQGLRILLNCSPLLSFDIARKHLTSFSMRMQASGYDHAVRFEIIKSALIAYKKVREADEAKTKPMYRNKNWMKETRRKDKELKKKNWYTKGNYESVLFIPATPESELKNSMQRAVHETGIRIKIVEKSGVKIIKKLQQNNPFKQKKCNAKDCFVCRTGGKGNCRATGISYKIECKEGCPFEYTGQTGSNAYTRGIKHQEDYTMERNSSNLWKHCQKTHNGEKQKFKMTVVDVCRNDPTKRQILEAVRIRKVDPLVRMNDRNEWNVISLPRTNVTNQ